MMLAICSACAAGGAPRQVIIDTDPGTDDAIAIMLALNSPELAVRALTVVAGNVPAAQGLDNALRLVSLARRCDLPVAIGAQRPLVGILTTAELYHGKNGLGDVQLPPATCAADKRWAPDLIVDLVHAAPHGITLITIGPLTNIALALSKDPSIVPLVKEVIMMGGSVSGGNASPAAEFNVYVDPEAAKIVFEAGWPLTMVGLDVGDKALLTRSHLAVLAHEHSPMAQLVSDIGAFLLQRADRAGRTGASMYDRGNRSRNRPDACPSGADACRSRNAGPCHPWRNGNKSIRESKQARIAHVSRRRSLCSNRRRTGRSECRRRHDGRCRALCAAAPLQNRG